MGRLRCLLFPLLGCASLMAQTCKIQDKPFLLTQEKAGWRVQITDGARGKYSLESGDLLLSLDGKPARRMGPLGVADAFHEASVDRIVPIAVRRGSQITQVRLWRSDDPTPSDVAKTPEKRYLTASQKAPDFTLLTLSDARVRLASERGRWVLLSFWATWCAPCMQEAEALNRLARAYPERLSVLALALKESRDDLTRFAAKVKPVYTILDAGPLNAKPALSYGVGDPKGGGHVPVNVLVRPDGTIAYILSGYEEPSPLEQEVAAAVAGNITGWH